MLDFKDILIPEQYSGKWVAFEIDSINSTIIVLYAGNSVYEVVNSNEVQGKEYVLHKFV